MNRFHRRPTLACIALLGLFLSCSPQPGSGTLPVYSLDQTDSPHAGYRRTTITSAGRLPGLVFAPAVYFDPGGKVYLAENLGAVGFHGSNQSIRASWIPASVSFTRWSKTSD